MNTKRIEIRGVILDASWDSDWMESYISKGMFTPESRVRAQLAEAEKDGNDVEIYINSYGGSCIAGNEMLAAIQSFKGKKTITVGAYAASMAANIALQAGCEVKCHNNSLFLFHGSHGVTFGGKGAHLDSADVLSKLNGPMQKRLIDMGVPEAMVAEGFAEGRQMVFTAEEAKEYGVVVEIINAPASPSAKVEKSEMEEILTGGLPVEALAAVWTADTPPEETLEAKAGRFEAELIRARADLAQAKAEVKAVQSACDKRIGATQGELESVNKEFSAFKDASAAAAATSAETISTLTLDVKAAKDAHAALVGGVLANMDESDSNLTWPDLVARHGQAEALKRFPEKAQEYRDSRKSKKN